MAIGWFGCLLISIITTVSQCQTHQTEECFEPTAALYYYDNLYLIDGNKFVIIDAKGTEIDSGTVSDEFGLKGNIDAAFVDPEEDAIYFNSGTEYFRFSYWSMSAENIQDETNLNPFLEGGIGAAGVLGGKNYFFKGCEYQSGGEDEGGNMKTLGLPCDIGAAWRGHDGKLYVTKEGQYWSMDEDRHVTGPEKLSKLATLKSTKFCNEDGDNGCVEIGDEVEYEKEHNCVIIDAAITWRGMFYLFNNDEYLAFDRNGRQYRKASISSWRGLDSNIDAGVIWSGNHGTYFFKDGHYYRYSPKGGAHGPRKNIQWGSHFVEGIDAAGNFKGKTIFFQGCEMLLNPGPRSGVKRIFKNEDFNLPCNVDAAFTRGRRLYVIKFNQIWFLHKHRFIGPKDLTSVLRVSSWNVCSPQ